MKIYRFNHFFIKEEAGISPYYHASPVSHEPETILVGGDRFKDLPFNAKSSETILETFRPDDCLSFAQSVFFCKGRDGFKRIRNVNQSNIFNVEPLGEIHSYDINWLYKIEDSVENRDSEDVEEMARSYWEGEDSDDPIIVYVSSEVVIHG